MSASKRSLAILCACALLRLGTSTAQAQVVGVGVPPTSQAQPDREVQIAADAFAKDATTPPWVLPHPIADFGTPGPAVLALADSQLMVGDRPTAYVHRAIRINDASVLSTIGRVPLVFIPDYQRLVLHALQVVRAGAVLDRLPTAEVRFLQRETGLERNVYSGAVTASILVDDLRVGDTLEIAFSLIGTNPVFGPTFSGAEGWDQTLPIEERRVVVNAPVGRRVAWKTHGELKPSIDAPRERVVDGMRSLTFEGSRIAALPAEASVPSGVSVARWIEFSEYADWQAVATWAATLFVDDQPASAERRALVATLMAKPTVEERVVAALEFVQSQVRYFSVSLGASSHRPAPPNTVLTRRYGDCKDKSLLLVALLRDMGIDSTPALARLNNRTGFADRLPTPLAFDHVIVEVDVDGSPYFLDATRMGQHGRLARMGQVHDGAEVLPASVKTRALLRIDVPNRDALAFEDRVERWTMPKLDGDATLNVRLEQNGVLAELLRSIRGALTQDRLDAAIVADMEKRYPGTKLAAPVRIDDDVEQNRVVVSYDATVPKPAKRSGAAWLVPFKPENLTAVFTLPSDAQRKAPVVVRYPVNAHYTFDATFADEVAAANDPQSTSIDDKVFESTIEHSFRGNRSVTKVGLRTMADRVALADLPTLRTDLEKFDRALQGAVVVRDADVKKSGFLGIGRRDLATTLKSREEDTVARITKTLNGGRLTGDDLSRAYCDRGAAYVSLERRTDALADGDRAVEIDPNAPEMLVCRGEIRVGVRNFAPAIDDLSRAVVMGADGGRAFHLRGQAKFHLGRFAEAADDFAKANAVDRDERSTINHDLWRAMAFRRMDRPVPDDLRQRAETDARGEWPRPALALMADRLEPAELSRAAAKTAGDTAELNGTEADFYLGEYFLAHGEPAKARDAFASSRARGVIIYTEYNAAGVELDRLDKPAYAPR